MTKNRARIRAGGLPTQLIRAGAFHVVAIVVGGVAEDDVAMKARSQAVKSPEEFSGMAQRASAPSDTGVRRLQCGQKTVTWCVVELIGLDSSAKKFVFFHDGGRRKEREPVKG